MNTQKMNQASPATIAKHAIVLAAAAATLSAHAQEIRTGNRNTTPAAVHILPFAPPLDDQYGYDWRAAGNRATEILGDELSKRGVPVVVRANLLEELNKEQILVIAGEAMSAAEMGRKMGAETMISGRISDLKVRKMGIGPISHTEVKATLDVRLIDVERGVIIRSIQGTGSVSKVGVDIKIAGLFDSGDKDSVGMLTGALRKAAEGIAGKISAESSTLLRPRSETRAVEATQQALPAISNAARTWTVMVVVPETHLARPRIPDPAGETEIRRRLLEAGYRVYDAQRLDEIRNERWVQEMYSGTLSQAEMERLRSKYGVDVIVTGEAISERSEVRTGSNLITCRGRVEIKAIRLDNGQILASDDAHAGGQDLSEIMASKAALRAAGAMVAPKLIAALDRAATRDGQGQAATAGAPQTALTTIEIEIGGWKGLALAQEFLETLEAMKGVDSAKRKDYRAGTLFALVTVDRSVMKDLALALETSAPLKKFGLSVQASGEAKIEAKIKS